MPTPCGEVLRVVEGFAGKLFLACKSAMRCLLEGPSPSPDACVGLFLEFPSCAVWLLALVSDEMSWAAGLFAFLGANGELGLGLSAVACCVASETPRSRSARFEAFAECAMFA